MRMTRARMTLMFIFLLTGCTVTPTDMVREMAAEQGGIGVYAIIPDQFKNTLIGTTVFHNKKTERNSTAWQMNAFAEQLMLSKLRHQGVTDAHIVSTRPRPVAQNNLNSYITGSHARVLADVFNDARTAGLGHVAVIEPVFSQDDPSGVITPYGIHRIDRLQFGFFAPAPSTDVYVRLKINFYDTTTGKPMGRIINLGLDSPTRIIFKEDAAAYTSAEFATLEQELKSLLETAFAQEFAR